MTDAIDLLDREHQHLAGADDVDFVRRLRRFHEFITGGPERVREALEELRSEAAERERAFQEHDRALIPELVELKQELVERATEADDSDVPRPRPRSGGRGVPSLQWQYGFANFDQLVTGGPDRTLAHQGVDMSVSSMLLSILQGKLRDLQMVVTAPSGVRTTSEENLRPDLDDLVKRWRNLSERHRYHVREFEQAVNDHGGFQVQYLDMAVEQMNPEPTEVNTDDEEHAWMDQMFRRVAAGWNYLGGRRHWEAARCARPPGAAHPRREDAALR